MLRDSAVALIAQELGFRTDQSANIVSYMQLAQSDLEGGVTKPWFLKTGLTNLVTVPNVQTLPVPSDFLEEIDDVVAQYLPGFPITPQPVVPLVKDSYNTLLKNFSDVQDIDDPSADTETIFNDTVQLLVNTGPPQAYALVGNLIYFFPIPDLAYTITFPYVQAGVVLTSNVENVWLKNAAKWLMGETGIMIAQALRDKDAIQTFTEWVMVGRSLVGGQNTIREMAGVNLQVGGPH